MFTSTTIAETVISMHSPTGGGPTFVAQVTNGRQDYRQVFDDQRAARAYFHGLIDQRLDQQWADETEQEREYRRRLQRESLALAEWRPTRAWGGR